MALSVPDAEDPTVFPGGCLGHLTVPVRKSTLADPLASLLPNPVLGSQKYWDLWPLLLAGFSALIFITGYTHRHTHQLDMHTHWSRKLLPPKEQLEEQLISATWTCAKQWTLSRMTSLSLNWREMD